MQDQGSDPLELTPCKMLDSQTWLYHLYRDGLKKINRFNITDRGKWHYSLELLADFEAFLFMGVVVIECSPISSGNMK